MPCRGQPGSNPALKRDWDYSFIAEVLGPEISAELIREAHSIPLEEIKQEQYETSRFYRYLCRQVRD